jgi:hypothetical protein
MATERKQWTSKYWGATRSGTVGLVTLVAGIYILAVGQMVGLLILAFAAFFAAMFVRSWRRGES